MRKGPKATGIEPKIVRTTTSVSKVARTGERSHDSSEIPSADAQPGVRRRSPEMTGTRAPLLDEDPRNGGQHPHEGQGERQVALTAFRECLERWGLPLPPSR